MKERKGFKLPASFRIKKKQEFSRIIKDGKRWSTSMFLFVYIQGSGRMGISISRKYGNAVSRNRFKRYVREAFRLTRPDDFTCDFVVMPRQKISGPGLLAQYIDTFIQFYAKSSQLTT